MTTMKMRARHEGRGEEGNKGGRSQNWRCWQLKWRLASSTKRLQKMPESWDTNELSFIRIMYDVVLWRVLHAATTTTTAPGKSWKRFVLSFRFTPLPLFPLPYTHTHSNGIASRATRELLPRLARKGVRQSVRLLWTSSLLVFVMELGLRPYLTGRAGGKKGGGGGETGKRRQTAAADAVGNLWKEPN